MFELYFIQTLQVRLSKNLSSLIKKVESIAGFLHFQKAKKDFHLQ
jgi:hypothetical protein